MPEGGPCAQIVYTLALQVLNPQKGTLRPKSITYLVHAALLEGAGDLVSWVAPFRVLKNCAYNHLLSPLQVGP